MNKNAAGHSPNVERYTPSDILKTLRRPSAYRHPALAESAVKAYAPELWQDTQARLQRWLKAVLAALRPQLNLLLIQRAYNPETVYLEDLIRNVLPQIETNKPSSRKLLELSADAALTYGFLPTDPRRQTLDQYTQELLEDDLFKYWQTLTNPKTLAQRISTLRADGVSVDGMARELSNTYKQGYYSSERLIRTTYNSSANYANYLDLIELYDTLEWLTARDARVRPGKSKSPFNHRLMDGRETQVGQPFITPTGSRLRFPGDRSMGASTGDIANCRCTATGKLSQVKTSQNVKLKQVNQDVSSL